MWSENIKKKTKVFVSENKFLIKPILVCMAIYLVGILVIILAGVHYADDIGRTERGYAVWANFSRYINEILSRVVHADNYLTNIAPLPQILATMILAVASVMLICVVVGKDKLRQPWTKWIVLVVAVVPLGLSPYMLECLSYQYDAVYMAMSVFFAVLPLTMRKMKMKYYLAAIVVGTLGVCMTYQAVVGIFPMLMIFLVMKEWTEGKIGKSKAEKKKYIKNIVMALVVFGLTLVVFQKFLMIPRELYVSNSLPGWQDLIPETLRHLGRYFGLVFSDFKIWWLAIIGIILVIFVGGLVKNSKQNKILTATAAVGGAILMAVCAFAIYSMLEVPLYAPRAMYAIGVFLAVICVYVVSNVKMEILKVPVFVLGWCFVVFAFTYGNALGEQDRYRNMKIDMVMDDLNELDIMKGENVKILQTTGDMGKSPVITHMPQDYQMLNRLLSSSYGEELIWTTYRLVYLCDMGNVKANTDVNLVEMNLPVVKNTAYYDIRADDSNILVEFKESRRD